MNDRDLMWFCRGLLAGLAAIGAAYLLTGCGGLAGDPEVQDVAQALQTGGWCCDGIDDDGGPERVCGFESKPAWAERCYCAGVRRGDGTCDTESP